MCAKLHYDALSFGGLVSKKKMQPLRARTTPLNRMENPHQNAN